METSEDRMVTFHLLATGHDLKAFRALEPAATTFFFKLRCIQCGEATVKDVCLRPADAQMIVPLPGPCSYRVRRSSAARYMRQHCYPTCHNPAHIVRKCKACGSLGSVELVPAGVAGVGLSATRGGSHIITALECIGYTPLSFSSEPDWTLTTLTGEQIETSPNIIIEGVKLMIKNAE